MRTAWLLALALLVGGCAQNPVKPDYYAMKLEADEAYRQGDFPAALKAYRLLVEEVPREADLWFKLGNIYTRLGKPEAAVTAYREALVREPELAKAWNNLGVVHMRQAVNAYLQLCHHAKPGDALCGRAQRLVAGVNALLAPPSTPVAVTPDAPEPEAPATPGSEESPLTPAGEKDTAPTVEEPAMEGTAPESVPSEPQTRGLEWLAGQDPGTYFVQLSSGFSAKPSLDLAQQFALSGDRHHLFTARNSQGEVYFQLLQGPFADYDSALAAIEALPAGLAALRPTIRRSASLQALRGLQAGEQATP